MASNTSRLVAASATLAVAATMTVVAAGSASAAEPGITVDGQTHTTNDSTPTLYLPGGTNRKVSVDSGETIPWPDDVDGLTLAALDDGEHQVIVTYFNGEADTWNPVIINVDTVAPKFGYATHGLPGDGHLSSGETFGADIRLSVPDDVALYEYKLDGGAWTAFSGDDSFGGADGPHQLTFRVTDKAGNVAGGLDDWTDIDWTIGDQFDNEAPKFLTWTTKPAANVASGASSTFGWYFDDFRARNFYSLDGAAPVALAGTSSGVSFPDLADGSHVLSVYGVDPAGNKSDLTTYRWVVGDASATPVPVLTLNHTALDADSTQVKFTWDVSNGAPGTQVFASIDGAERSVLPGDSFTATVGFGKHTIIAQAVNATGAGSTPVQYTWTASDKTAPKLTVTKSNVNAEATSVKFAWTTNETSTVYGSLDGAATKVLAGSSYTAAVKYGKHTFSVYALDAAGNKSVVSSNAWTAVDKTAPVLKIADGEYSSLDRAAYLIYSVNEASSITATFDGKPAHIAAADKAVWVDGFKLGKHTFNVTAKDAAGNVSKAVTWTFAVKPVVTAGSISSAHLAKGIKAGSAKADIQKVQLALGAPDGIKYGTYDSATVKLVKKWQKAHHLYVTGVVNSLTWKSLVNHVNDGTGTLPVTKSSISAATLKKGVAKGAKGQDVVNIQRLLKVTETGTFDSKTVSAVKKFQSAKHLKATGVVTAATWAKLVG